MIQSILSRKTESCQMRRTPRLGDLGKPAVLFMCVAIFLPVAVSAFQGKDTPGAPSSGNPTGVSVTSDGAVSSQIHSAAEANTPLIFRGNPVELEPRSYYIGMLEFLRYSIEDVVTKYDQFEARDADILVETSLEISSLMRKIADGDYQLTDTRMVALSHYLMGLGKKVSAPDGLAASREYFERAAHEDSTFADPRWQLALFHLRCTGDSATAMEHLIQAMQYEPDDGEVLRVLGLYYLHYDNLPLARKNLEEAARRIDEEDPRLLFYLGLIHDPYWSLVWSMNRWVTEFSRKQGRRPTFTEAERKRRELLRATPDLDLRLDSAMVYYKKSVRSDSGYVRPLNSLVWVLANQVLLGFESHGVTDARGDSLTKYLGRLSSFVGYGLADPRSLNTLALGYASLGSCSEACDCWKESIKRIILLSPAFRGDLSLENQRIWEVCDCSASLVE